jgi:hypothetical protein
MVGERRVRLDRSAAALRRETATPRLEEMVVSV